MTAELFDPRLVKALFEMEKAFAVYDRALFYLDTCKPFEVPFNFTLSYQENLHKIERVLARHIPNKDKVTDKQLNFIALHVGSSATLKAYQEAWKSIYARRENSAMDYSNNLLEAKNKNIRIIDRDITIAHNTANNLNSKYLSIVDHLANRIKKDIDNEEWCSYEVEFRLLRDRCKLLIDEINHILRKDDRVEDLLINSKQLRSAKASIKWAVWGIAASVALALISLFVTLAKNDGPVAVYLDRNSFGDPARELEIGKISEKAESIKKSLNNLTIDLEDFKKDYGIHVLHTNKTLEQLKLSIEKLAIFIDEKNIISLGELQSSLGDLESSIKYFLNGNVLPFLKEEEKVTGTYFNKKKYNTLVSKLETLQSSVDIIKADIDRPEERPVQNTDKSKTKKGFLNWF